MPPKCLPTCIFRAYPIRLVKRRNSPEAAAASFNWEAHTNAFGGRIQAAHALFQRAARLPRIDVRKPSTVVGRTTVGAMESGLFYGYVGMVEGLVRRMSAELGGNALCIATGGLAIVIAPETPLIDHVDIELTLQGLRIVWERNQRSEVRG